MGNNGTLIFKCVKGEKAFPTTKSILQVISSCFVQKTAWKNTKYSRNKTISKMGHYAKAIAFAKSSIGSKIKIPKNMSKSILQEI